MASVTKLVGTATTVTGSGDLAWSNASNVTAEDANAATVTNSTADETSEILKCTMTGNVFSIPSGARIDGVEISYSVDADGGTTPFHTTDTQLVVGGDITGLNRRDQTTITPTTATITAGGSAEKFSVPLTVAAVNAGDFGVALRFIRDGSSVKTLNVYWVKITVYYTAGAGDVTYDSSFAVGVCGAMIDIEATSNVSKFKFPGLGTPKAAVFIMTAVSDADMGTDGTDVSIATAGSNWSIGGAVSPTDRYSWQSVAPDGEFTSQRNLSSTKVGNPGGDISSYRNIDLDGFSADTVSVVFEAGNINAAKRFAICIAFAGSSVDAALRRQNSMDGTETADVTDPGFLPDLLMLLDGLEVVDTGPHGGFTGGGLGFATSSVQVHVDRYDRYHDATDVNLPDLETGVRVSNDRFHHNEDIAEGDVYYWTASDFDANGYTINSHGDDATLEPGGDDGAGILALITGAQIATGTFVTPTATGAKSFGNSDFTPDIGFTPSFMMMLWTKADTLNTSEKDSAKGEVFGLSLAQGGNEFCFSYSNQNAQNPTNSQTVFSTKFVDTRDGDQTDFIIGTFGGFTNGGLDVTFSVIDGTSRVGTFLALAPQSSGVALTIDNATIAVSADSPSLTQAHVLAVQPASIATTADNVDLTQLHQLAVQSAALALAADNLDLAQVHNLVAQAASLAMSADNVVLSVSGTLTIADALLGLSAANLDLAQAHQIVVADAALALQADNLVLTQAHTLVIGNALLAMSADNLTLAGLFAGTTPADRRGTNLAEIRSAALAAEVRSVAVTTH